MTTIAVIGPGAIGGTVAAWLAQDDAHRVTVCARTPLPDGLAIETPDGVVSARPPVLTDPAVARPVDWVLVATKTYDVAAAQAWLPGLVGPTTRVAVLQNGVEHRARFAGLVAPERLVPVIVDIPAERRGAGRVLVRRHGTMLAPDDDAGRAFGALFATTPIEASVTADWTTAAWRKLAINSCGIVQAIILKPFASAHDEGVAAAMRVLVDECAAVGRAEGADLPAGIADEIVTYYRAQAPDLVNSMHADRVAGRPLELDARDGVIVRLGERHRIPTPAHAMLVALLAAAVA